MLTEQTTGSPKNGSTWNMHLVLQYKGENKGSLSFSVVCVSRGRTLPQKSWEKGTGGASEASKGLLFGSNSEGHGVKAPGAEAQAEALHRGEQAPATGVGRGPLCRAQWSARLSESC